MMQAEQLACGRCPININRPLLPTPFNRGLSYVEQGKGSGCLRDRGTSVCGKGPGPGAGDRFAGPAPSSPRGPSGVIVSP